VATEEQEQSAAKTNITNVIPKNLFIFSSKKKISKNKARSKMTAQLSALHISEEWAYIAQVKNFLRIL